jgi:hypothetical protein
MNQVAFKNVPAWHVFKNTPLVDDIMKPISVECAWSMSPPDPFTREVIVRIGPGNDPVIRSMSGIDGKPGAVIDTIKNDMTGKDLRDIISRCYNYSDLQHVRFDGECLTDRSFRFIRDYALVVAGSDDDSKMITIESWMPSTESFKYLDSLLKEDPPLVDDICLNLRVPVPGDGDDNAGFESSFKRIVDALMFCIVALRQNDIRSVTIVLHVPGTVLDASLSRVYNRIDSAVEMMRNRCMEDDIFKDIRGIALNSFNVATIPDNASAVASDIVSYTIQKIRSSMIGGHVIALPPRHV